MTEFNPVADWRNGIVNPDHKPFGVVILSKVPRGAKISSRSLSLIETVEFVKEASSLVFLMKIPGLFRFYVLEF